MLIKGQASPTLLLAGVCRVKNICFKRERGAHVDEKIDESECDVCSMWVHRSDYASQWGKCSRAASPGT